MRNTRADVVAAALRVLDAHGLEFCSMRRVAAELGVQPSALYHHVPDKQALLALMADEIVRGVRGEDPAALCRSLRRALLAVRDGADVVATASAYRLGASAVEARLAATAGADGARTLLLYTFGHAQATQTELQARAFGVLPPVEIRDPVPGPDPAADLPPVADAEAVGDAEAVADAAALAPAALEASFARGIAIILAGLAAAV